MAQRNYNWKPSPFDPRDLQSTRHFGKAGITMPVNYRLPMQIPVYDQGQLGSCTANSGASCYRYEYAQLRGSFGFDPSRLFLYYNTREIEGTVSEDNGAYIRDVLKALNKKGVCPESDFPYVVSTFANKPTQQAYGNGLKNMVVKYTAVDQIESTIKQTIYSGAAITFGFNVYESFESGWDTTTGVMPMPKQDESLLGGHAVTIIGWDDAKRCFLIQNSWGESWGQKGLFWMPYAFLLSNECDDFWCIDVIQITDNLDNPYLTVARDMFKSRSDLNALHETSLVALGKGIGADVDMSYRFGKNIDAVQKVLGI